MNHLSITLFVFAAVFGVNNAVCPHGWVRFRTACYGFGTDKLPWAEAEEMCRSVGASLVEVNTAEESSFLKTSAANRSAEGYWLGGTDEFEEGYWTWVGSGQQISGFTDWYQGEPNNVLNAESCLLMSILHQYQWIDASCGSPAHFVCETNETPSAPVG